MDDEKIRVRILPLKGIGGVGNAGDVVMMSASDAEMYVREGFVEIVVENDAPTLTLPSPVNEEEATEGQELMKPQARRSKRK